MWADSRIFVYWSNVQEGIPASSYLLTVYLLPLESCLPWVLGSRLEFWAESQLGLNLEKSMWLSELQVQMCVCVTFKNVYHLSMSEHNCYLEPSISLDYNSNSRAASLYLSGLTSCQFLPCPHRSVILRAPQSIQASDISVSHGRLLLFGTCLCPSRHSLPTP